MSVKVLKDHRAEAEKGISAEVEFTVGSVCVMIIPCENRLYTSHR